MDKPNKEIKSSLIISMILSVVAMVLCTSIGIHVISTGHVLAGTISIIFGLANAICLGTNFSNFKKE